MKQLKMIARVLVGGLLVSTVICAPAAEQKQNKVTKRDIGSMSRGNDNMDEYRGEILPGMVDDQVAEAFLKDAAREDEREERRKEQEEEEQDSDEDEGPIEVPLALPMARVVEGDDLDYAQEKPAPHRSKALAEDIYPPEDEAYLPYYPSGEVLFRRRRRSKAPLRPRVLRKRSPYTSVRDMLRPARPRSVRRKRQIRLSDSDLNALIRFLINVKVTMERASEECNNPQHHSFFREKELNEELGAGSGIDEDYSDEEQPSAPEQEYPVWLMPHAHQAEPVIPGPQRRSFYYPTLLPGQKRSGRYSSPQQRLENKLLGLHRSSDSDLPPRRFFQ